MASDRARAQPGADDATAAIDALSQHFDERLHGLLDQLPSSQERLAEAMRYAALGSGKRLRPLLVYASGRALGVYREALDAPAMAVELIHCYSLIHDDLPAMDDDALRRGRPTVHVAYDEATAILAGDALQALAFEVLAGADDAEAARGMARMLARACGVSGMAGGQALDLQFEGHQPSREAVEDMFRRKTGALIEAAVLLPAAFRRDLPADQHRALSEFAEAAGFAFQIRDDLLEIEGDTDSIGKSSDSDAIHEKASWPRLFGVDSAHRRIAALGDRAFAALERVAGDTTVLAEIAERLLNRRN